MSLELIMTKKFINSNGKTEGKNQISLPHKNFP